MRRNWVLFFVCAVALTGCDTPGSTPDSTPGSTLPGELWVAVGEGGKILSSPDGETWAWQNSGVSQDLHAVAHSGLLWVAVGDRGTIVTSTNGRTWQVRQFPSVISHLSSDGTTWTEESTSPSAALRAIIHNGALWMSSSTSGKFLTSTDGKKWTYRDPNVLGNIKALAYDGSRWVAVGAAPRKGVIFTSTDGKIWTEGIFNVPPQQRVNAVAHDGSRWVALGEAVGGNGYSFTSTDGMNWTRQRGNVVRTINAVAYADSRWMAVGERGTIMTSTDGRIWQWSPSGASRDLHAIVHDGSRWVAVGDGRIMVYVSDTGWARVQDRVRSDKLPSEIDETVFYGVAYRD